MKMNDNSENWDDVPLFAPEGSQIPRLSSDQPAEQVTAAIGALSHLLYDEETPLEKSEQLRDEGNRQFRRGKRGYHNAIMKYNDAISAAGDIPEALGPALMNRAMAEFKLENYGRALQDAEKALSLDPVNVKAYYRATLCAIQLEKHEKALQYCNEGLRLSQRDSGAAGRRNVLLFKRERVVIDKAIAKAERQEREKNMRLADTERKRSVFESMIQAKGITMGLPLFGQQRRYSCTKPTLRDGVWYWPILLVYPEEVTIAGSGDQSDFLEEVAENATMSDILSSVFGNDMPAPEWDVNRAYQSAERLHARYRTQWTMEQSEADSDDEETFCGSSLAKEEIGHWINVPMNTTLGELLSRKNYITPLFPVLYIVPQEVELD